ncbi:hypothetical protein MOQ_005520 [Trypanosoma cruzi marinkellei]|uniref:EF-hand domain-containing protein n=1 Tax=Trypanosoma cruzi marinkellei TaxID=85056 RepID=K2MUE7_TRYCR|nr:hypothetical protein MOQ_005520 [Trypanosoma cruzi marinkellei]
MELRNRSFYFTMAFFLLCVVTGEVFFFHCFSLPVLFMRLSMWHPAGTTAGAILAHSPFFPLIFSSVNFTIFNIYIYIYIYYFLWGFVFSLCVCVCVWGARKREGAGWGRKRGTGMRYTLAPGALACDCLIPEDLRLLRDSFIQLDTDGDGFVRLQELNNAFKEEMTELGLPCDTEALDLASYLGLFARHVDLARRLAINVSVELSDDEMRILEVVFDNMDTNGDGFIDEEELCSALAESLGKCKANYAIIWLTGLIMARVGRNAERRIYASDFIRALQEDNGVIPKQLLGLPLKFLEERGRLRRTVSIGCGGMLTPLRRSFSPYGVLLVLRVAESILCNKKTLTAAQFCASLTDGFLTMEILLGCDPEELASHICRRALLLSPYEDTISGINCGRFLSLVLDDPGSMLLNVPSPSSRLESSMRHFADLSYDFGRHLALCLLSSGPDSYSVQQLDELPQRLRATFPALKEVALWDIVRYCTAAAEVKSEGVFSLQRLVRRLTIRFCVLPCDYPGKLWRRLSPLERCRIRSHLGRVHIEELYTMSRQRARELVRMSLLSSDDFWDQEHVALTVALCVESMIFLQKMSPEEVRRAMAQEAWPPSDDLVGDDCRTDIAVRMMAVNLGREGLSVVTESIVRLDTSRDCVINEELLLSTLRGVVKELRPRWSNARVDRAVCDVVLGCALVEGGGCVNCGGLLERLRHVQ